MAYRKMFDGGYLSSLKVSEETMQEYDQFPKQKSLYANVPGDAYTSIAPPPSTSQRHNNEPDERHVQTSTHSDKHTDAIQYDDDDDGGRVYFRECPLCRSGVHSCNCVPTNFVCSNGRCNWKYITHTHLDAVPIQKK